MMRWAWMGVAAAVGVAAIVAAEVGGETGFDEFARTNGVYCAEAPSRQCFDRGFAFADRDGNGGVSLAEAHRFHDGFRTWGLAHRAAMPAADQQALLAGLLVVQAVGVDAIFASYDVDGDGRLTRSEAAADLRLDDRPMPVLLDDPRAVDWARVRTRLGPAAVLLVDMLPPAS